MTVSGYRDEIIDFVINSSDVDNLIIATFIAGMQATKSNRAANRLEDDEPPHKPSVNCSA